MKIHLRTPLFIIGLFAAVIMVTGAKGCDSKKDIWNALDQTAGIPRKDAEFKKNYTTPAGIKVVSVDAVPAGYLSAIDEGIRIQIERYNIKRPQWQFYKTPSDYAVLLIKPSGFTVETPPLGTPFIQVKGISTAGTVIGCSGRTALKRPYIVLPSYAAKQWSQTYRDVFVQAARNESEHIRECVNDWNEFVYYATAGDVHPHAP